MVSTFKMNYLFSFVLAFHYLCNMKEYVNEAVELLKQLIAIPSVSREETAAADLLEERIHEYGIKPQREGNNIWALSENFDTSLPTVLLNAHIDTVRPVKSWTMEPFRPFMKDGKLYGLGANDCGGGLVSLLQVFRILKDLSDINLVYLASAEEEVSGKDGISRVLPLLPKIDVAIVGEPTAMQPAVAEKGLMVLDITARGKSGHAARNEGVNAIYEALDALHWFRSYQFERVSPFLGATQMQVTVINAGTQHNVVPDECCMVVDVRTNELYTNKEVFDIIEAHVKSEVKARSFRLGSSHIDVEHPLIRKCVAMGMVPFGSPTLSDQAQMSFPSFKLGPGYSSRSHSADEYICISEIEEAIHQYVTLLRDVKLV